MDQPPEISQMAAGQALRTTHSQLEVVAFDFVAIRSSQSMKKS